MPKIDKVFSSFSYSSYDIDFKSGKVSVKYPVKDGKGFDTLLVVLFCFSKSSIYLLIASIIVYPLLAILAFFIDTMQFFIYVSYALLGMFALVFLRELYLLASSDEARKKAIVKSDNALSSSIFLNGKLDTNHVIIKNAGNFLTDFETSGEYSKYLVKMKMECKKFSKKRFAFWIVGDDYVWDLHIYFCKPPRGGSLKIYNYSADGHNTNKKINDGKPFLEYV